MDYVFRVNEDGFDASIKYARKYASRDGDNAWLAFGEDKLTPEIHDDYFMASGNHGEIYFAPSDFTSEILKLIIECNPDVVDKDVLLEVVKTFIAKEDKAKD